MNDIWFTSDTHFGHARIAEFCPQRQEWFNMDGPGDIDTMNRGLLEVWNDTVKPGDKVFHQGDFAMGQIDKTLGFVSRLFGDITLTLGNHDRPHPSYSKTDEKRLIWMDRYYEAGFDAIQMGTTLEIGGQRVLVNHFPYEGDSEGEDRYPQYRLQDEGKVLIHGHIHDMWQVKGRQINTGFDAWGRLLHWDEVVELVKLAA